MEKKKNYSVECYAKDKQNCWSRQKRIEYEMGMKNIGCQVVGIFVKYSDIIRHINLL